MIYWISNDLANFKILIFDRNNNRSFIIGWGIRRHDDSGPMDVALTPQQFHQPTKTNDEQWSVEYSKLNAPHSRSARLNSHHQERWTFSASRSVFKNKADSRGSQVRHYWLSMMYGNNTVSQMRKSIKLMAYADSKLWASPWKWNRVAAWNLWMRDRQDIVVTKFVSLSQGIVRHRRGCCRYGIWGPAYR